VIGNQAYAYVRRVAYLLHAVVVLTMGFVSTECAVFLSTNCDEIRMAKASFKLVDTQHSALNCYNVHFLRVGLSPKMFDSFDKQFSEGLASNDVLFLLFRF